jgi:hypothetical protein
MPSAVVVYPYWTPFHAKLKVEVAVRAQGWARVWVGLFAVTLCIRACAMEQPHSLASVFQQVRA